MTPARFSPDLASAVIEAFSDPGDLVADYFVGGGTTLVEARLLGRLAFGSDVDFPVGLRKPCQDAVVRHDDAHPSHRLGNPGGEYRQVRPDGHDEREALHTSAT